MSLNKLYIIRGKLCCTFSKLYITSLLKTNGFEATLFLKGCGVWVGVYETIQTGHAIEVSVTPARGSLKHLVQAVVQRRACCRCATECPGLPQNTFCYGKTLYLRVEFYFLQVPLFLKRQMYQEKKCLLHIPVPNLPSSRLSIIFSALLLSFSSKVPL